MDYTSLFKRPPSENLDFFELDKRMMIPNLFPTICAFLNTYGGVIFIGVTRDKEFQTITIDQLGSFIKEFHNISKNNKAYLNPALSIGIVDIIIDGHPLVVIEVPNIRRIFKTGDKIYIRKNITNQVLEGTSELEKFYQRKKGSTELDIIPYLSKADLDLELLNKARSIAQQRDSTHKWLSMSDDEILRASHLYLKDLSSGKEGYTLACALLLGKKSTIKRVVPEYKLDIFIRKQNIDRWDDILTLETNLIDTRNRALDFLKDNLPASFFQEGTQRIDLRDVIFREVIGNIIVHREYRDTKPTTVVVEKNRVIATNPSIVFNRGHIDLYDFSPDPKNPCIRRFFNELGWSDEAGSGVRNIRKYLDSYAHGAIPEFIEDEIFTTKIPLKVYLLGEKGDYLLQLFSISKFDIDTDHLTLFAGLFINPDLDNSSDKEEFLQKYMRTLIKNEGELQNIKLLKNSYLELSDKKSIGSLEKIGGDLMIKKGAHLMKILIGLLREKSLDESLQFSESDNRNSFRDNYLNVLKKDGLIAFTIPEKPNDPNQKYVITDRGKALLAGMEI